MPEWSTDGDLEELGTFDSSGAFVSTQMKPLHKVRAPPPPPIVALRNGWTARCKQTEHLSTDYM